MYAVRFQDEDGGLALWAAFGLPLLFLSAAEATACLAACLDTFPAAAAPEVIAYRDDQGGPT